MKGKVLVTQALTNLGTKTPSILADIPVITDMEAKFTEWAKGLVISGIGALCTGCIIFCGLCIIWFIMDNKSGTPQKYVTGSYIVYFGLKIVEFLIK